MFSRMCRFTEAKTETERHNSKDRKTQQQRPLPSTVTLTLYASKYKVNTRYMNSTEPKPKTSSRGCSFDQVYNLPVCQVRLQ